VLKENYEFIIILTPALLHQTKITHGQTLIETE